MELDARLVEHVAQLARLGMTPEEREGFVTQLARILEYVGKLNALDVTGVEPLVHPFDARNVFRPDEVRPTVPREEILALAPDRVECFYKVPKVIE